MCIPALGGLGLFGGGAAATTAGATAAATTGLTLQGLGTILAVGGSVVQGIHGAKVAKANAELIEDQRDTQKVMNAQKEQRVRRKFNSEMRKQIAELAERGVSIDSPTAVLLGQEAASEMSFQGQAVRQEGAAQDAQLATEQSGYQAKARSSFFKGMTNAAGDFLSAAPKLWPNLGAEA